jgi:cytosine/adenosine deaminase-related metal-dependent hydrolase
MFPPGLILELATLNGAKAMGMDREIGSLEPGKKADFVMHDTNLPEWGTVFDSVTQLALCAAPHGVHSVWINGVRVLDDGRNTLLDEDRLLHEARAAGYDIVARTGLPNRTPWPVL